MGSFPPSWDPPPGAERAPKPPGAAKDRSAPSSDLPHRPPRGSSPPREGDAPPGGQPAFATSAGGPGAVCQPVARRRGRTGGRTVAPTAPTGAAGPPSPPSSAPSPGPRGAELPAAGRGLLHEVLLPVF